MPSFKLLENVVSASDRGSDRWYVSTGTMAVGPVELELLARGVEAGRVPLEAFIRHEAWRVWKPLSEIATVLDDDGTPLLASPMSIPPASLDELTYSMRPASSYPAMPGVSELHASLMTLLTAAVARTGADAAIVHEMADEGAFAVCAHGASSERVLDQRMSLVDPALLAAAAGITVIAEPSPGPAGQAAKGRLAQLAPAGEGLEGVVVMPIRPKGKLIALIEVGRRASFRAAEIASLEELVGALVAKLEAALG